MKKIFYILILVFSTNVLFAQKTTLLAYWSFDDSTAHDNSGNGYHGTIMHSPKPIIGVDGYHTAFHFVGKEDYTSGNIGAGDHILLPSIDLTKYPEFTITMWVREQAITTESGEAYIWFGYVNYGWVGIDHCWQHSSPQPPSNTCLNYSVGSNVSSIWPVTIDFNFAKDRNRWVHYAMVYNRDTVKAYKDGKLVKKGIQKLIISSKDAAIARHWWTYGGDARSSTRFTGDIDEVMIYSTALDDTEIEELYLVGKHYVICEGESVIMKAPDGYVDYQWSDGKSGQNNQVDKPGSYTVTVKTKDGRTCVSQPYIVEQMALKYSKTSDIYFEYKNDKTPQRDSVIIENNNSVPFTISDIFLLNNTVDKLLIATDKTFPFILQPNQSLKIYVEFIPNQKRGFTDSLVLVMTQPCNTTKYIGINGDFDGCDEETWFEFERLYKTDSLSLFGKAFFQGSFIRMTQSNNQHIGAFWYRYPVPVKNGFITSFRFRLLEGNNFNSNEKSLPGGDGFAFVMAPKKSKSIGLAGGGIGYSLIPNSLAVEFDMFSNDKDQIENFYDPNGNHIAVQSNGKLPNFSIHSDSTTKGIKDNVISMKPDGTIYYCTIDYNVIPNTLRIFMDTTKNLTAEPLIINNFILEDVIQLDQTEWAEVGFTAATGTVAQIHDILSWEFCPFPSNGIYVGVEDEMENNVENIDILAHPNPFNDNVSIVFRTLDNSAYSLKIYSILGEEVFSISGICSGNGKEVINWNDSQKERGYYMYVLTINGRTVTGKLMKY